MRYGDLADVVKILFPSTKMNYFFELVWGYFITIRPLFFSLYNPHTDGRDVAAGSESGWKFLKKKCSTQKFCTRPQLGNIGRALPKHVAEHVPALLDKFFAFSTVF